ncbi:hypothetical protein B0H65DRAFT_439588 [Neurospora tetraspora]|uniref:Uncharacterized protein n=1 Tax=Neurospora tetraspora TaxID=94610 RepID=A0AAE0JJJ8_9PEZI|nr:hypothetical protein B0H65DRAFT_439588 [Neurospora tetraspora]
MFLLPCVVGSPDFLLHLREFHHAVGLFSVSWRSWRLEVGDPRDMSENDLIDLGLRSPLPAPSQPTPPSFGSASASTSSSTSSSVFGPGPASSFAPGSAPACDSYPLPTQDSIIARMRGKAFISCFDGSALCSFISCQCTHTTVTE